MKELLQNAYEMDSNASEALENADQISFDMDEMFSPLVMDPEKLSQNEKEKYEKLNKKFYGLRNRMSIHEYLHPYTKFSTNINSNTFIEVTNLDNWKKYKLYNYFNPAEFGKDYERFPYIPQLIVSKNWEVIANSQLTAADYETALKKIEKVLDKLEEGREIESSDAPI